MLCSILCTDILYENPISIKLKDSTVGYIASNVKRMTTPHSMKIDFHSSVECWRHSDVIAGNQIQISLAGVPVIIVPKSLHSSSSISVTLHVS